jgi:hypothetical protein
MIQTLPVPQQQTTVTAHQRRSRLSEGLWLVLVLGASALLAGYMLLNSPQPTILAWLCFALGVGAIVYHPRNGLYMMVFFGLLGDSNLTIWYPFNKNLSSHESLLFLSDNFSFTPLEIAIALTFGIWLLRMAFRRKWELYLTPLLIPITAFTAFALFGIYYGFSRGGDRTIGLWE